MKEVSYESVQRHYIIIYNDHPSRPQKEYPIGTVLEEYHPTTQRLIGPGWPYFYPGSVPCSNFLV